jgi:hypothetical protein
LLLVHGVVDQHCKQRGGEHGVTAVDSRARADFWREKLPLPDRLEAVDGMAGSADLTAVDGCSTAAVQLALAKFVADPV